RRPGRAAVDDQERPAEYPARVEGGPAARRVPVAEPVRAVRVPDVRDGAGLEAGLGALGQAELGQPGRGLGLLAVGGACLRIRSPDHADTQRLGHLPRRLPPPAFGAQPAEGPVEKDPARRARTRIDAAVTCHAWPKSRWAIGELAVDDDGT